MTSNTPPICEREYDFALVVQGVPELSEDVINRLFEAGCDDATPRTTLRAGGDFGRHAIHKTDIPAVLQSLRELREYASREHSSENLHRLLIEINRLLNVIETRMAELQPEAEHYTD